MADPIALPAGTKDYRALPMKERMKAVLTDLLAGGTERNKAISLAALSVPESSLEWTVERTMGVMESALAAESGRAWNPEDPVMPCWRVRTVVGLEPAGFVKNEDGKTVGIFPKDLDDGTAQPLMDFLKIAGYIENTGNGTYVFKGDLNVSNSTAVASLFEMVVAYRLTRWLKLFSLGPTQMWLSQSPVAGGPQETWPQTWDEIWSFYLTPTVSGLASRITYYDKSTPWPSADQSEANVLRWLGRHTGGGANSDRTKCYYSPDTCPVAGRSSQDFKAALEWAISVASKIV